MPTKVRANPLDDLIVGIPCGELGYSMFWQKLSSNRDYGYLVMEGRVLTMSGAYVHGAHNKMAQEALSDRVPPWKRFMLIEHDHEFPMDVFRRHAAYTDPIVSALYVLRDINQPLPVIYQWDAGRHNTKPPNAAWMKKALDERGMYEVDVVPMGCVSIRRDVLETWPQDQPMFNSFTNPRGATMSDDVWFCRIAQDNGWPIHVDTSLPIKHICQVPIDDQFFVRWWNARGAAEMAKEVAS